MADQGKWFKLWVSSLFDDDLENLTIEQWFRWVRLGTYVKCYGTAGSLRISAPAQILQNILRVTSFDTLLDAIKALPKCNLEEVKTVTTDRRHSDKSYTVTIQNWHRYQVDSSGDRMRKYRMKKQANVTVQEERRREETLSPKSSPSKAALRSAPPDAPAPLRAAVVQGGDERPEYGHENFLAVGVLDPEMPHDEFGWTHLENNLSREERVQSKLREKFYREKWRQAETSAVRLANQSQVLATPGGDDDVF